MSEREMVSLLEIASRDAVPHHGEERFDLSLPYFARTYLRLVDEWLYVRAGGVG